MQNCKASKSSSIVNLLHKYMFFSALNTIKTRATNSPTKHDDEPTNANKKPTATTKQH